MKPRKTKAKLPVEKVRALYWAEIHMQEARDTCFHLMRLDREAQERLSHCIYTGIVVSYARSFGDNQGLSGIESVFRKFPDARMQSLHDVLLEARHNIFAHKNRTHEPSRLSSATEKEKIDNIQVRISEDGTTEWEVNRSSLPKEMLPDIAALCSFQIDRMHTASTKMLRHFCQGKSYSPGTYYILGQNFP